MLKEQERVVLLTPIPAEGLEAGDVSTIVHLYPDGRACEVKFVALDGHTRAVATVEADQVRRVTSHDMTHAREKHCARHVHGLTVGSNSVEFWGNDLTT